MAEYAFPVTEALIDDGIGKEAAEKADAYLAALTPGPIIRPRVMAAMTGLSKNQVETILGKYAERGTLKAHEMIECEECRTLNFAEEVATARADKDDHPCDGCGVDLTQQGSGSTVLAFQLLDTPT
jgi:hypothetical protein